MKILEKRILNEKDVQLFLKTLIYGDHKKLCDELCGKGMFSTIILFTKV